MLRLLLLRRSYSVLFFGSDDFAVPFLDQIVRHPGVTRVRAVATPDARGGRGQRELLVSPVKAYALAHNVDLSLAPPKDHADASALVVAPEEPFDIGVVVSFPYFLTPQTLSACRQGVINFHPSLLPLYRGAAPIQHTVLRGDTQAGMSIIDICVDAWDAGNILAQRAFAIDNRTITYDALAARFMAEGPPLVLDVLDNFGRYWVRRALCSCPV